MKRLAYLAAYIGAMPDLPPEKMQGQLVKDLRVLNEMDNDDRSRLAEQIAVSTDFEVPS